MNNVFNMLDTSLQSQILQMDSNKRINVMNEIMLKMSNQNTPSKVLNEAFESLPLDKQLYALQGGYKSMADEFRNLEKKVEDPLITIKKPIDITEKFEKDFPLLAVNETNMNKDDTSSEIDSSSSNNISESTDINVKKISM
jgi:hypothetical protein